MQGGRWRAGRILEAWHAVVDGLLGLDVAPISLWTGGNVSTWHEQGS